MQALNVGDRVSTSRNGQTLYGTVQIVAPFAICVRLDVGGTLIGPECIYTRLPRYRVETLAVHRGRKAHSVICRETVRFTITSAGMAALESDARR